MAANAAPLLLGGMALFLLSRRGDGEGNQALPEPDPPMEFSCENLVGVWHKPKGNNLPVSLLTYEVAYEYMQERYLDDGGDDASRSDYVLGALDLVASGCHWEDQMKYSERMVDVYNAMQVIYEDVTGDLSDGPGGPP